MNLLSTVTGSLGTTHKMEVIKFIGSSMSHM